MEMFNPPHPGEIIKGLWLDPIGATITQAASAIGVSRKTLSKIINKKAGISPEMSVRLSIALGGSPESWLKHQMSYDLWQVSKNKETLNAQPLTIA